MKHIPDLGDKDERGMTLSLQLTSDGGYLLVGNTFSYGPGTQENSNIYVVKTDSLGNVKWETIFGGEAGDYAAMIKASIQTQGGYIIMGTTESLSSFERWVWVCSFNPWKRSFVLRLVCLLFKTRVLLMKNPGIQNLMSDVFKISRIKSS